MKNKKYMKWAGVLIAVMFLATMIPVDAVGYRNEDPTIIVKGGFGVNIEITNNLENDSIAFGITVAWKNIRNGVVHITNIDGTIMPYEILCYRESTPPGLIKRVYVYVVSEGVLVEKDGFAILFFVFLG